MLLIAGRARGEIASGLKNEAAENYRRVLALSPEQVQARRLLANLLYSKGDLPGAERAIDEALDRDPRNAQLAEDRIALELKSSGTSGAVAIADQLRAKYPGLPTGAALEGDAYMGAAEYGNAADAYTKALEQSPSA